MLCSLHKEQSTPSIATLSGAQETEDVLQRASRCRNSRELSPWTTADVRIKTRDRASTLQMVKGHKRTKDANEHQKLWRAGALGTSRVLESHDELMDSAGEAGNHTARAITLVATF